MKIYKEEINGRTGFTVWDEGRLVSGPHDTQQEAEDWLLAQVKTPPLEQFMDEVVIPRQDHVTLQVLPDGTLRLMQENRTNGDQIITIVSAHNLDLLIKALEKARTALNPV